MVKTYFRELGSYRVSGWRLFLIKLLGKRLFLEEENCRIEGYLYRGKIYVAQIFYPKGKW